MEILQIKISFYQPEKVDNIEEKKKEIEKELKKVLKNDFSIDFTYKTKK